MSTTKHPPASPGQRPGPRWSGRSFFPRACWWLLALTIGFPLLSRSAAGEEHPAVVWSTPTPDSWSEMTRRDGAREPAQAPVQLRTDPRLSPVPTSIRQRRPLRSATGPVVNAGHPRSPSSHTVATGFPALSLRDQFADFGTGSIPPDTMGAIGPDHFLEVINTSVAVFDRHGRRLSHVTLDSFFRVLEGGVTYPRNGTFDPRVLYDRRSGRWFASAVERGEPSREANHLLLAVSATSDPTGAWFHYLVRSGLPTDTRTYFSDFAALGTDDNGVYLGVSIFTSDGTDFARVAALDKAPLLTGAATAQFYFSEIPDLYSTPIPALNFDPIAPESPAWFVASWPHTLDGTDSANLSCFTLTWSGPPGARIPALGATRTVFTPTFGFPPDAPVQGSVVPLDVTDMRLQNAVVRNQRLWTCRTVGVNAAGGSRSADRSAAEWLELQLAGGTAQLRQSGRVFDHAPANPRFFLTPSLAVNGPGHAVIAFTTARATEFAGAGFAARLATDPLGSMGEVLPLKSGEAAYERTDRSGRNRWGDYSLTSVDPRDDLSLWTVQEYAKDDGANIWGTWVARLIGPAPTAFPPGAVARPGMEAVLLTVSGTGFFDPGPGFSNRFQITLGGGSPNGIGNYRVAAVTPTVAQVFLDVAPDAAPGPRDLVVTNPDGQQVIVPNAFRVTAAGATVSFDLAAQTVTESAGPISVLVRLSAPQTAAILVPFTVSGTATSGSDFTLAPSPLNFPPGATTATLGITLLDDRSAEPTKSIRLTLGAVANLSLGAIPTHVLTLTDNDGAPTITLAAAPVLFVENAPPLLLDPTALVTGTHLVGAVLTVDFAGNGTAADRLGLHSEGVRPGEIATSGGTLLFGGQPVGTVSGGLGTNPLTVRFTAGATLAAVQAAVRKLTFQNLSDAPAPAPRTVRLVLADSVGNRSAPAFKTVTLQPVNDPPASQTPPSITGDARLGQTLIANAGTWTDPERDAFALSAVWQRANQADGSGAAVVAGSPAYLVTLADAHQFLRVLITGTDAPGASATAASAWRPVANHAPRLAASSGRLFSAPASFGTVAGPQALATGDVNHDGFPDLVVANYHQNTVSIFLNNGDATFRQDTDLSAGTRPNGITLADLNRDGRPDLVTANASAGTVSVFLARPGGGFAAKTDFAAGRGASFITAADVNGDGLPDLVTANYSEDTVAILRGRGDGTFLPRVTLATGRGPVALVVADLNGDGRPDLAVANQETSFISLYFNRGNGSFGPRTDLACGASPRALVATDLNGDGLPDLVVTAGNAAAVSVLLGKAGGAFQPVATFGTGINPRWLVSADFNADGRPDLAVANSGSDTVSLLLGNGDGTFLPRQDFPVGANPRALVVADFNRDGRPDLLGGNFRTSQLTRLAGTSASGPVLSGNFLVTQHVTTTTGAWTDADNDRLSFSYQWQRSPDARDATATAIPGATAASYLLSAAEIGTFVRALITATDTFGGATTAPTDWRLTR